LTGARQVAADELVVLDYADVSNPEKDLSDLIHKAYGYEGLGLLAVAGVPEYMKERQELLPLAQQFATLPDDIKAKYEHADSLWSFGWSHGKEKLEGKPDYSKGSYYGNPQYDVPFEDDDIIKAYPAFAHPNIWPEEMPQLAPAFKHLGQRIVGVGSELATHIDKLVAAVDPTYPAQRLKRTIDTSRVCKARLLYYFPPADAGDEGVGTSDSVSNWCGWHNDHGSLTGLCNAMFLDRDGNEVPCPDPDAGLFIRSRQGDIVKVNMPPGTMAFQIGETAQIHSGGVLQATPHSVGAAASPEAAHIGRATYAVFMEPEWDEPMAVPDGADQNNVLRGAKGELLPPSVPPLASRWNNEQTFGQFTDSTLNAYY
jgi:isopenicillin N synthase-like dioxygenase